MSLNLILENSHPDITLTPKELEVFRQLHDGVRDRQSLMVTVWGFSTSLASKVSYKDTRMVDMTISRLKKKLAPAGVIISSVRGVGYILTP
jgi:two-component system, OmpR family, phosphate regulon response regulator PhoB